MSMPACILKVDPRDPDPAVIRQAAEMIREGLVVAYPTDTLYGLAVDPRNASRGAAAVRVEGASRGLGADADRGGRGAGAGGGGHDQHGRAAGGAMVAGTADDRRPSAADPRARHAGGRRRRSASAMPDHAVARGAGARRRVLHHGDEREPLGRDGGVDAAAVVAAALPDVDAILDAGPARGGPPSTIVDASRARPDAGATGRGAVGPRAKIASVMPRNTRTSAD